MRVHKRHILLLEVLIAFSIVVMCILPMLQPFLFMLSEERRFMREVELDRLVGVFYGNLLIDGFYRGGLEWRMIESKEAYPIDDPTLIELGFTGTYSFKIGKKKGKIADEAYTLFLLKINYEFRSITGGEPLKYTYDLFVQRDKEVEDAEALEGQQQPQPQQPPQQPQEQQQAT